VRFGRKREKCNRVVFPREEAGKEQALVVAVPALSTTVSTGYFAGLSGVVS